MPTNIDTSDQCSSDLRSQENVSRAAKSRRMQPRCGSISRATREIEENPGARIEHDRLSHLANVPARIFRREFRRSAGMTPYQYLLKVRTVQAASIILADPEADLKEVAKRLGFASAGALIRKFKREHGCSIEQYRALHASRPIIDPNIHQSGTDM